jgi:subtilisin family serine protease
MAAVGTIVVEPVAPLDRRDAAAAAFRAGLMPLDATGIRQFAELAPGRDGRGVLIAILDSGIDPAVAGLDTTSDGRPKLVDLRDFSGEGRIPLARIRGVRDSVRFGPRTLHGVSSVTTEGPLWAGLVAEVRFGHGAAADLNGNGSPTDTLLVLVTQREGSWVMYADAQGDGTVANDQPIRDYRVAREWFGWSRSNAPPMGIAANFADSGGTPVLHLVFDNAGHGSHVAGVAAGFRLHGVEGFDGVAPGAQVLGFKIARNAEGGITSTGSMRRAIAFAIATARERRQPLVINVSFGVGNQREGTARIDAVVDSILDANPDVVMTVAASNDGPGLSTLGFPASAAKVLAIGATQPLVFEGLPPDPSRIDPVAPFSSRGGERAGPDLVAPGVAWSALPRFASGSEEQSGTSMAAPHVAGIVARLINVLESANRRPERRLIHHALRVTARPIPDATVLDQGAGLPDIAAAARWLQGHRSVPELVAVDDNDPTRNAVWLPSGAAPATVKLRVRRNDGGPPMRIRVRSGADWMRLEGSELRELPNEGAALYFALDTQALASPGVRVGSVIIESADDDALGRLLQVPVTVRVPVNPTDSASMAASVHAGSSSRMQFLADTGRGVRVEVRTLSAEGVALMAMHEPGGQPLRDVPLSVAGFGEQAGMVEIDARDMRSGYYEVVVVAPPTNGVATRTTVFRSPVRLSGRMQRDSLLVEARSLAESTVDLQLRAAFSGVEWQAVMGGNASVPSDTLLIIPPWARQIVVDVAMAEADWSRFTDFGVTLWHRDGRLLAEEPLNYAFGRLRIDLPPEVGGDTLRLALTPAAAIDDRPVPWRVEVSARYFAERPLAIDRGGAPHAPLAPGGTRRAAFAVTSWPVMIPAGLSPLVTLIAVERDNHVWTREIPLPRREGLP